MTVKKQYRLIKDQDFKRVIAASHVHKNRFFVVYHDQTTLGHPRVGISASKKLGNAVVRNRIRRQIKAMLHQTLTLQESYDILVIVRLEFKSQIFEQNLAKLTEIIDAIRRPAHE